MKQRKINYRIYHHGNEIVAVSSFAKKPVRGVAKCDPRDEFDHKKGEALAIARCDYKIAEKRVKKAEATARAYKDLLECVNADYADALAYRKSAREEFIEVNERLRNLKATL